jgi:hypothetical protein
MICMTPIAPRPLHLLAFCGGRGRVFYSPNFTGGKNGFGSLLVDAKLIVGQGPDQQGQATDRNQEGHGQQECD